MSIFGGLALIAPMLTMALHDDHAAALAVTSGSVVFFAIIVAVFTPASPEVALGAVSAYAAGLVVFVGSTLSPGAVLSFHIWSFQSRLTSTPVLAGVLM